jgi:hypothetical protein
MAHAIGDGLPLEAIAADIAGDGDSALERAHHRKRPGEPSIIATVPGAGYRIVTSPASAQEGGDGG